MNAITLDAASSPSTSTSSSNAAKWVGRALSGFAVLFLLFDVSIKLSGHSAVAQSAQELGLPMAQMVPTALTLLACVTLYVIPRSSVLGAVLLTGYLGGAIEVHARVGSPVFSHLLFPVYVAAFVWGGLYLRDLRVRQMISAR
ncbi:MAG: DoxX family protein [Archangium sp.]